MEIVSDEEPEEDLDLDMGGINLDEQRVEEDESTLGELYSKAVGDRTFQKFARRVERAPEQILRYNPHPLSPLPVARSSAVLPAWFADTGRYLRLDGSRGAAIHCAKEGVLSDKDFPKCRSCAGDTDVEFQIMPGLLAQMDSDIGGKEELDWGVLNVLTCKANCKTDGQGFVEEFLWRQEVSLEGLKSDADM